MSERQEKRERFEHRRAATQLGTAGPQHVYVSAPVVQSLLCSTDPPAAAPAGRTLSRRRRRRRRRRVLESTRHDTTRID